MASTYNPFRGCKRCSEGCLHCYIHKGDAKRKIDTSQIVKTTSFYKPIEKKKNGEYKMKSTLVYLCFQTDFLIEEADRFRDEIWQMIKQRSDCDFLFLTKRIERMARVLPSDWGDGYDNVIVGLSLENQKNVDKKLPVFVSLPIKHRIIAAQPLLEKINLEKYLDYIEEVLVGGESDKQARALDYSWVLDIREQCIRKNVDFTFRQCGSHFIKDGVLYHLQVKDLVAQARKANIDYHRKEAENG
ncbi:MAG: DUF5131 family protein [Erysipelotrichaceae bacterium]